MWSYENDPDYDRWLAEVAAECSCCPVCQILPCPGCSAGGICDTMCTCPDDDDEDEDERW